MTAADSSRPTRVLFVCLGNICRSPTAEAVLHHLVHEAGLDDDIEVDSAGTGDWHAGELRDARSRATGEKRGMPLRGRARQVTREDFDRFDYVVAMDRSNRADLLKLAPHAAGRAKVKLLRAFDPASDPEADVPDPYYGGASGFDEVFDICVAGCRALLDEIRGVRGVG